MAFGDQQPFFCDEQHWGTTQYLRRMTIIPKYLHRWQLKKYWYMNYIYILYYIYYIHYILYIIYSIYILFIYNEPKPFESKHHNVFFEPMMDEGH